MTASSSPLLSLLSPIMPCTSAACSDSHTAHLAALRLAPNQVCLSAHYNFFTPVLGSLLGTSLLIWYVASLNAIHSQPPNGVQALPLSTTLLPPISSPHTMKRWIGVSHFHCDLTCLILILLICRGYSEQLIRFSSLSASLLPPLAPENMPRSLSPSNYISLLLSHGRDIHGRPFLFPLPTSESGPLHPSPSFLIGVSAELTVYSCLQSLMKMHESFDAVLAQVMLHHTCLLGLIYL